MFPLPNVFLIPGTLLPLHVFEPRYRQMIADSLDGPGRIVIASVLETHHDDLAGNPPVFGIGGLGEIAQHERLPDGRYYIVLAGLVRVAIRELPQERCYRMVEALPLCELSATPEEDKELRPKLVRAILSRTANLRELPPTMQLGQLADFLLLRLQLPQTCMQDLYSRRSVADRARHALAEHARRPTEGD